MTLPSTARRCRDALPWRAGSNDRSPTRIDSVLLLQALGAATLAWVVSLWCRRG